MKDMLLPQLVHVHRMPSMLLVCHTCKMDSSTAVGTRVTRGEYQIGVDKTASSRDQTNYGGESFSIMPREHSNTYIP